MILKDFKVGFRNILKNGIYSFINILGLSLGIAVVILILFWVVDELSYDKFHKNSDRIYTVYEHQVYSEGQELFTFCTPFPLSKTLIEKYSEVENATTFTSLQKMSIKFEDKEYKEGPVFTADDHFFDIFSYTFIEGSKDALSLPNQVIITDELARLYFGNESPIGKTMKFNNQFSLTVGAVIAENKNNSSIGFKVLCSNELLKTFGADLTRWGNNWPRTSVLLKNSNDAKTLGDKILNLCKDNGQENTSLFLFPFTKEHLYSYSGKNNRIQYIYQFLAIAAIIILIASINFINLSIAKAEQRRPEVGIRKVMGANKFDILKQFLLEKGMMIIISLILSSIFVLLFLPAFRSISDKSILLSQLNNRYMYLMLLVVIITVLVLSVAYPSAYLSSFNPINTIKKAGKGSNNTFSLKSMLVVIQFVLAVILISGSITISQQIKFVNNYDIGYDHANLIYISFDGESKSRHEAIRQELSGISGVLDITRSDKLPFWGGNSSWGYNWEGKDPENKVLICRMGVDNNYFKTMGIKLVEGNPFPDTYKRVMKEDEITSFQVILNKEAIKRMDIKDPIGKYFGLDDKKGTIIGVADDFHFESLHTGVEPLLILPLFEDPDFIILKVNPENLSQTISAIKGSWKKIVPQSVCEVGFFDEQLGKLYNAEVKISRLFKYFSFIAIFISCIGLFGLSLFVIERRKKEIGIRKVNGAKTSEVMILLNKDFVVWVIVAFIIATPLAWFAMHKWLENFTYKTNLSWWFFATAGVLALVIALLTVSWQSWKAARRNPVEALKYE